MKISVVGFDPSMSGWGIAVGELDLTTGHLQTPTLTVVEPIKVKTKQVRQNSTDLDVAEQLAKAVLEAAKGAKAIFAEVPVGSQSARAMASYGICVGILGSLRAGGVQVIEVTATEVKVALSGDKNATKAKMISSARDLYPDARFPMHNGKVTAKAEHAADALGAIHAGVNTPMFQNLMKLYES